MLGTRLQIACVVLVVASAETARAGIMVSITGQAGRNSVNVSLSGSQVVDKQIGPSQPVSILQFTKSPSNIGPSSPIKLQGSFGSLRVIPSTGGTGVPYGISEVEISNTFFTIFTTTPFAATPGETLALSASSGSSLLFGQDINTLGIGTFSLTNADLKFTQSLSVERLTGNPPPVVPEPTSIAIFGVAALGMAGMGMRRKRKVSAA